MVDHTDRNAPTVRAEPAPPASPDAPATLHVHVRNVAESPQDLIVRLRGLEANWVPGPLALPGVAPDATVTVEIPITPARGTPAGDYPFVVEVEAKTATERTSSVHRTVLSSVWTIDEHSDLVLSIEPIDSRGLLSKRAHVQIANSGTHPREVVLSSQSERGLKVALGRERVTVGPHETASVKARLRTRRLSILHNSSRRSYTVVATGNQVPTRVQGTFQNRPLLPSGVMRGLSLVLVLVLWGAGAIVGVPWVANKFDADRKVEVVAEEDPGAGGAQGSDDEPGDAAPGTGSDNGSTTGDDDPQPDDNAETPQADAVRISGAILGSAPQGVTVDVRPASSMAAASASDTQPDDADETSGNTAAIASIGVGGSLGARAAQTVWHRVTHSLSAKATPAKAAASAAAGKFWREALPVQRTAEEPKSTVTDADGTWAIAGMNPDARYLVTLSKPGFQTARYFVTGAQAAEVPLEVELVAGEGSASGVVTGPQGRVGGAEIILTDGVTTLSTRTATSGDVGSWAVTGLTTPSTYLITAVGDGLGSQSRLTAIGANASRTINMELRRGVGTLRGKVSGQNSLGTRTPLGSISVVAQGGDVTRTATTVTSGNAAGTFVLPDLPVPGKYTVTISGDGYLTQVRTISLTHRKSTRALDLQLGRTGGSVVGSVTDEDRVGLTGAGMILTSDDNTYKTMSSSDGKGGFRFDGVVAGTYVLSGQVFGHETAFAQVRVRNGRTAQAELVLTSIDGNGLTESARIRGRAVDATTGASVSCPHIRADETCAVTVTTEVTRRSGAVDTVTATQLPDAQYTIPGAGGLLPGRYKLNFAAPGYEPTSVNVEVAMDRTAEAVTAALYPSPSISGNVLTRVGALPPGTCVVAVGADGAVPTGYSCITAPDGGCTVSVGGNPSTDTYCAFADSTAMGGYAINRLSSGTYQVRTYVPPGTEYLSDTIGVTITLQGGDAKRYDATLDRLGRVALTALRSTGTGSLVAGAGAFIEVVGANVPPTTVNDVANASGFLLVTGLPESSYTITARDATNPNRMGQLTDLSVGLNQEISAQLVITSGVTTLVSHVLTQIEPAASQPVPGAQVTVTGIVRYSGVVPVRETVVITQTNAAGQFQICTNQPCSADPHVKYLPLIEDQIDIEVTHPHYVTFTRNNVPTAELATITLEPRGAAFVGSLVLQGADPSELANLYQSVGYTVTASPPGVGALSLSANATGRVFWSDALQGVDPAGGRFIRPGTYRVQASLPGFDSIEEVITVGIGQTNVTATFTLRKFGELRVFAMARTDATTLVPQEAPTMEIRLRDGSTRIVDAPGSRTYVDFGALPSGTYQVTAWLPGFAETTSTVTVQPGQQVLSTATGSPQVVLDPLSTLTGDVVSRYADGWYVALGGATVEAEPAAGNPFTTATDNTGTYRITGTKDRPGLADGTWTLSATAPNHTEIVTGPVLSERTLPLVAPTYFPDNRPPVRLGLSPAPGQLQLTVVDPTTGDAIVGLNPALAYSDGIRSDTAQTTPCQLTPPNPAVYCFTNLLPLTYMLSISGTGYSPIVVTVPIEAGQTKLLTVPMTNPGGSVQGTVTVVEGSQVSGAVGALVEIVNPATSAVIADTLSTTGGNYLFEDVSAGTYILRATYEVPGTPPDVFTTERTIVVGIAQSLFVDLQLVQPSAAVTVEVTSTNGFDLTGALVSIHSPGGDISAQPAVRVGSTGNLYTTTFAQVPFGTWTARVTGPTGHLGVHTSTNTVTVSASNLSPTLAMNVAETRIQLTGAAQPEITVPPSTLTATLADLPPVTVPVGDSTIVFVPRIAASRAISGTAGNFNVVIPAGQAAVPGNATTHSATLTIERHEINITLNAPSPQASVTADAVVTWGYTISSPTAPSVIGGTMSLLRDGVATGGTFTVPGSGSGSRTYTAAVPLGTQVFTISYTGSAEFQSAVSNSRNLTVNGVAPTINVSSSSPGAFSATLPQSDAAGTVGGSATFAVQFNTGSGWTNTLPGGATCGSDVVPLTCSGLPGGSQARAVYTNTNGNVNKYATTTSTHQTVQSPPPPPDPEPGG